MTTVNRELAGQCVGQGPLQVSLRYDLADPYAVKAIFHSQSRDIVWTFARELLTTGITTPAGNGDVQVSPAWAGARQVVALGLSSQDGAATVHLPAAGVRDFLAQAHAACPAGQEQRHLDVDRAIRALLA